MKNYYLYQALLVGLTVLSITLVCSSCKSNSEEPATETVLVNANDSIADKSGNDAEDIEKKADVQFIIKATEISLEEIQLGLLAQKIGSSKEIRDLGKMMETEHTKSLTEITDLAKTKSVTIPTELTFDARATYDQLNLMSGKAFDQAYVEKMTSAHNDAIALFEAVSKESKDSEISDWATKSLPALKMHLSHATRAQKAVQ